jgi:hypothetical protein
MNQRHRQSHQNVTIHGQIVTNKENNSNNENSSNDQYVESNKNNSWKESSTNITNKKHRKNKLPLRETKYLEQPPSARDAAFCGPPRYDWIDIVRISYCRKYIV